MTENTDDFGLHTLKPAPNSRRPRKRVGRGEGSGTGKTSGRGQKGAGSRSGSKARSNFEGGQMPIHMRMRKLRGPHMKKSMPFEPFRTHTQIFNIGDLEARFESGDAVTINGVHSHGLCTKKGIPAKVLAEGDRGEASGEEQYSQAADRPRAQVLRCLPLGHRGRPRTNPFSLGRPWRA